MRDRLSIAVVEKLHPYIRQEVAMLLEQAEQQFPPSVAIRVAQGLRTIEYQNELYAIGRTVKGKNVTQSRPMGQIVTKARGGTSLHNYGLAIDFCLLYDKNGDGNYDRASWDEFADFDKDKIADWQEVCKIFEAAGYEWGGAWSSIHDAPHLQKSFGLNYHQMLEKYNNKDFIPGTKYINI